MELQESRPLNGPDHSAEKWDQRAEAWEQERKQQSKGDERVSHAVTFLQQRGILNASCDIVDVGCGPGRFAAEFAKNAHWVLGLDISPQMVKYGMEHIKREGVTNAVLRTCDFQKLDIEKEKYHRAFDLVFSSMTPAIHGMAGLTKMIKMSRAWCCNITHLRGHYPVREAVMQEVFGKKLPQQWTGRWFYSLFNVLFLMGYYPETSYEIRHQERKIVPDKEYAAFLMEYMLPPEECSGENMNRILHWLKNHAEKDGYLREVSDTYYGIILWDIRNQTERPDYRSMEQGV